MANEGESEVTTRANSEFHSPSESGAELSGMTPETLDKIVADREARLVQEPLKELGDKTGIIKGTRTAVRDLWRRRELFGYLVRRELKAKYKDSSFGFAWSLVKPLAQLLIYFIVIGHFLGAARGIPQFAIFVFSGLTAWTLFADIINGGTGSIVANSGLVKKVYLPREVFPLSVAGNALVNFLTQFIILLIAVVCTFQFPHLHLLVFFPLALLLLIVYGLAGGLFLSAINVYLRDVQHLIEVITFLGFWASPIVYSYSFVANTVSGWILELYLANPITLAILGFQRTMWAAGVDAPYPTHMILRMTIALIVGILLLFGAHRVFVRLEGNFAQEL